MVEYIARSGVCAPHQGDDRSRRLPS